MLTVAAFIFALVILIAVHEAGHYSMAVLCGVKVLRFSIGFGPRALGWTSSRSGTEFVLCVLPLGGYVKMLDGREGVVPPEQQHRAFDSQSLWRRALIVAAGPVANLLLAILLYSSVYWAGTPELEALLCHPTAGSLAEQVGFVGGERVLAAGDDEEELHAVRSMEDFRWRMTQAAIAKKDIVLAYEAPLQGTHGGDRVQYKILRLSTLAVRMEDPNWLRLLGWPAPYTPARIGEVLSGGAAAEAGLRRGDFVHQVDGVQINDAEQLRELIRHSGSGPALSAQRWLITRDGQERIVNVFPHSEVIDGQRLGRVGAMIGGAPTMVVVQYGVWEGAHQAVARTWDVSTLTLKMMGRMVSGEASLKNLSGPVAIADFAGKSAAIGWSQYVVFLALISISLGVLNLLPIPVLDGGHLMYYLWESVTGRAVSSIWMAYFQRAGLGLLLGMMSIAIFNDFARLLG